MDSIEVITHVIKQNGYCNFCGERTGDKWYVFCAGKCRDYYLSLEGKQMGQYDIDKDLYIKWFEEKTLAIEKMSKDDIEKRIIEIYSIEFYCKREFAMLNQHHDKIAGRHGLPKWVSERDTLITDPHIKVNWEGEPRKREKKPKENLLQSMLGIDIRELTQQIKKQNGGFVNPEKPEKVQPLSEALEQLASSMKPKVEVPKVSAEDLASKAAAIREKMRLAKEKKGE